jgi:chemotaxis protein methyltransferase CheR
VLERAAAGVFPLDKMRDYTANYINGGGARAFSEYYVSGYDGARFERRLTENVVFAQHNLVSDRSFNEFHAVVCRNVLIYFDRTLQTHVHALFHESLVTFGVLALGARESIRGVADDGWYDGLDDHQRLYRKVS